MTNPIVAPSSLHCTPMLRFLDGTIVVPTLVIYLLCICDIPVVFLQVSTFPRPQIQHFHSQATSDLDAFDSQSGLREVNSLVAD